MASFLGVRPRQVVFTSGGTEAVNAAVYGATSEDPGPIGLAGVEHSSVIAASSRAGPVALLPVDRLGRIDADALDWEADRCRGVHGRVPRSCTARRRTTRSAPSSPWPSSSDMPAGSGW